MSLPKVIAFAWTFSVLLSVAIAVARDQPILQAFAPIKGFRFYIWQILLVTVVSLLASLQLYSDWLILGQQPMTWACLLIAMYTWFCLWAYFKRGT